MTFHKEGYVSLLIVFVLGALLIGSAHFIFPEYVLVLALAVLITTFFLVVILQFFRSPNRKTIANESGIIAPADGKVVVIEEVEDTEYFKKKVRQESIFMSPLNVHINWYPVSGEVVYSKYHAGKFLVAWNPKSSTDNERHSVVVKHPKYGEILVKQIAGAVARRIVNYSKVGEQVEQGEEMGFIKFGSRVDLLIPLDSKINVELDQVSKGRQLLVSTFNQ